MTSRQMLIFTSLSGFCYVILAALASHKFVAVLDETQMRWLQTGLLLQIVHTLAIGIVAILHQIYSNVFFRISSLCFMLGILFFCGSLYVLALTQLSVFPLITPLGGIVFMIGWLLFLAGSLKMPVLKKQKELLGE